MLLSNMCACNHMCFLLDSMDGIGAMKFEAHTKPTRQKGPSTVKLDYMCGAYSPVRMRRTPAVHDNPKNFKSSHTGAAKDVSSCPDLRSCN